MSIRILMIVERALNKNNNISDDNIKIKLKIIERKIDAILLSKEKKNEQR